MSIQSYGLFIVSLMALLMGCSPPWNEPHAKGQAGEVVYQTHFHIPPQHLDPGISYSSDESTFIAQIYEAPLSYHFLKRPFALQPLLARQMPEVKYYNEVMDEVSQEDKKAFYSRYIIRLKHGVLYQPHPAFVKDGIKQGYYFFNTIEEGQSYRSLSDFHKSGTREMIADDFLYQIKRLAAPATRSPISGLMSKYIVGMDQFVDFLRGLQNSEQWLDLRKYSIDGIQKIDDYTYTITLKGVYPQFMYWLATSFFVPIPWEVDRFYSNPGFNEKNLTLDWYPVGTGPFMMTTNNPNQQIVLERNPNFRDEYYPKEGEVSDLNNGFLQDAGNKLPFIDKAIFHLEKSALSLWTKFLQGYYDRSGEEHGNVTQNYDQVLIMGANGISLSPDMQEKEVKLSEDIMPGVYYYGFNMLDPVVGGYSEKKRKLRQAIAVAWNIEEYINIFMNGSGIPYMGPVAPGIRGYMSGKSGINKYTHNWKDGEMVRKNLDYARTLLKDAGYPDGRDIQSGQPLRLYFDVQSASSGRSSQDWQRRQLEALGIQLEFRISDWNRYKEKLRDGNFQLFMTGWLADYPDPENFLFLLTGAEAPLLGNSNGVNAANYNNDNYNRLFDVMKVMSDSSERDKIIAEMIEIIRHDAPWFSGYYVKEYYLDHQWVYNGKRHGVSKSYLKYLRIDDVKRAQKQQYWNIPNVFPIVVMICIKVLVVISAVCFYRRRKESKIVV